MTNHVKILDGVVSDTRTGMQAGFVIAPDEVQIGWRLVNDDWLPPIPTATDIDAQTQTVILAGLGYELKDLQAAMIKQMNMIAEGSVLLSKRNDGSITDTETARLNYLLAYRDFVDGCRSIGAQRKADRAGTYPYPPAPAIVE